MLSTLSRIYPRLRSLLPIIALIVVTFLLLLQKNNLAASDLGRHIINGKVIVTTGQVFQNNRHSYTNPDHFAPNHHWLFGVIAYYLHTWGGFPLITLADRKVSAT